MGFFESELRKIVEPLYPDATYVGRACFVRLDQQLRAKLEFASPGAADHYNALRINILNRQEGKVDAVTLRLSEIWGAQKMAGGSKIDPHIWIDGGKPEWYGYQPSEWNYRTLSDAAGAYLEVFQNQEQTAAQQWGQTM